MAEIDIGLLKKSINNLTDAINKHNVESHLLLVYNLLSSGIITKEEAYNDELFKEYISKIKNNNTIKAHKR